MFESVRAHLQSSIAQRSNHLRRIEDHLTEIRNFVSVGKEHAQAVRYLKQQRALLAKKQAIEKKLLFAVGEARFHHQNQADLPWYLLEMLFVHK